ncbi:hypothetical protein Tco_0908033 [Tanacetum coccineum]|uniref:Reverse transcriptase domain-containing protein n=1 Tax=Tanacetum coccineum TaxID=301880 RepID=A0ABQ5CLR2_9ASTR
MPLPFRHMLQRCEDTNLSLNWEKSHFMVKEGIVLGHKISKKGIEVDKAKIDVIAKLPSFHHCKELGVFFVLRTIALKYLFAKKDARRDCSDGFPPPRFDFKVIILKERELAAIHLSRLEKPNPWFARFAKFHAGNFVVKGISSDRRCVHGKEALDISMLATMDPGGHHGANSQQKILTPLAKGHAEYMELLTALHAYHHKTRGQAGRGLPDYEDSSVLSSSRVSHLQLQLGIDI